MSYPACFESQEQYDQWINADNVARRSGGDYRGNNTLICADCTPSYAASMRLQGRCEHTEIRFYRAGKAYRGGDGSRPGPKLLGMDNIRWELCDVEAESDAKKPGTHA